VIRFARCAVRCAEPITTRGRTNHSLPVEVLDGRVDCLIKRGDVGEGLMGKVLRLQVMPNDLNVIEFGRVSHRLRLRRRRCCVRSDFLYAKRLGLEDEPIQSAEDSIMFRFRHGWCQAGLT
jgi:hypothetical protein